MYRKGSEAGARNDEYFCLSIGRMSVARAELWDEGVVRLADHDSYPDLASYGLTEHPDDEAPTDSLAPAEQEFLAAVERWRTCTPPGDHVGIPSYKLCSNDGWLITPGEIRTSLMWADHHRPGWRDGLTEYVREFVEWMESTVPHGGFEVY